MFSILFLAQNSWILSRGLLWVGMQNAILGATINLVLNMFVIPSYGAVGASWTTVIAMAAATTGAMAIRPATRDLPPENGNHGIPPDHRRAAALAWPRSMTASFRTCSRHSWAATCSTNPSPRLTERLRHAAPVQPARQARPDGPWPTPDAPPACGSSNSRNTVPPRHSRRACPCRGTALNDPCRPAAWQQASWTQPETPCRVAKATPRPRERSQEWPSMP